MGQCSMSVALPILSACGHETCVLPTAVLSSHTGGFREPHIYSLAGEISGIVEHWKREKINFDFIYTGYLGSVEAVSMARRIGAELLASGGKLVVDPAMADNGQLYRGFDNAYVEAMENLCAEADIIIPNLTEAAMLRNIPYQEQVDWAYVSQLTGGKETMVLTGVGDCPERTGVAVVSDGRVECYTHKRLDKSYHGTGDMFSAAFVGALACGKDLFQAAKIGADFVYACIEKTAEEPAHWYGVKFEPALKKLMQMLEE